MNYRNKAAYLKGLVEGLNLDESKKETKIFNVIVDFCQDVASELEKLKVDCADNKELVYELDEDLGKIEKLVYGCRHSKCDSSDRSSNCGCEDDESNSNGDYEEYDDYVDKDKAGDEVEDEEKYEVLCPHCSQVINLDNINLKDNEIVCPQCGKELELDFGDVDESKNVDY